MPDPDPDDMMSDADRELLAALGEAWGDDPLPVGIIDRADGLLTWADVDEELAELLETSSAELAGTRGASHIGHGARVPGRRRNRAGRSRPRPRRCRGPGARDGRRCDRVWNAPAGSPDTAPVDELGHFSFPDPEPGAVRLRIAVGTGADVRTDWFADLTNFTV